MGSEEERNLYLLDPEAEIDEYDLVTSAFTQTLPDAKILRVQRVQNKVVWQQYFHCSMHGHHSLVQKNRLTKTNTL